MTAVKTYDGSPAYRLPNGTIVTAEAWDMIDHRTRLAIVETDAARNDTPEE